MNLQQAIVERMKGLLREKDITVKELAQKSKVSLSQINRILHYKSMSITLKTALGIIIQGFGITMNEFLRHPLFDRKGP